ncbi:MAG: NTP transferase domain-containing protein [Phycisphaerales bacterium]|nr:MAG: NTP transferase domain-containing protein [Phycisphaerales bacterium]
MGTAKAWLRAGNEYLLQRVVRIVGGVVEPVVVAARLAQDLPTLPECVSVVHDVIADAGPLAGVAAGFEVLAPGCDAAFVISCDHPLIKGAFVRRLVDLLSDHPGVIPQLETQLYPLTAIYRLDTQSLLRQMLANSEFRVHDFAHRTGAHPIPASTLADADPGLDSLRNVNDPAEYAAFLETLDD